MGMLDAIKQNIGPAWQHLGSPQFQEGLAYLQARRQGIPAVEILPKLQAARSARTRDEIMQRQVALDEQEQQQKLDALRRQQQMAAWQSEQAGMLAGLPLAEQQKYARDPGVRALWFSPYANQEMSKAVLDPLSEKPKYTLKTGEDGKYVYVPEDPNAGAPVPTSVAAPTDYQLKESATGEYMYVPSRPGMPVQPSGVQAPPKSGMQVSVDDQGNVTFTQGPGLTTGTRGSLEKKVLNDKDVLTNLDSAIAEFRPEYQTIGGQWGFYTTEMRDKLGMNLKPEERAQFADYVAYRARVGRFTAEMINELYGAVLAKNEESRASAFIPKVGSNPFDGDGPQEMQQKLISLRDVVRLGLMRRQFALFHGLSTNPNTLNTVEKISLDDMPALFNRRGAEIESELRKKGGYTDSQIKDKVREQLTKEFGI